MKKVFYIDEGEITSKMVGDGCIMLHVADYIDVINCPTLADSVTYYNLRIQEFITGNKVFYTAALRYAEHRYIANYVVSELLV